MDAIYFIETNGIKYYKTDTFWSKSKEYKYAKMHNDSEDDQERFLDSLLFGTTRFNKDEMEKYKDFYDKSIYGYQTIINGEIIETFNLNYIEYNKDENMFIRHNKKVIDRDEKIKSILD